MLWIKAWLEIRWRLAFALALALSPLGGMYFKGMSSPEAVGRAVAFAAMLWVVTAVPLAGSGIKTQSPLQGTKGLHGSTQFTLALPVSRFRLLSVRAGVGLLAMCGVIMISGTVAWALFPVLRANSTLSDFWRWIVTVCCCAAGLHALSILASTVLDEYWQVWATMITVGVLKLLTIQFPPPSSVDVFRVLAEGSPLQTHSLPWPMIAVSLGSGAVAFLVAVRVADSCEY